MQWWRPEKMNQMTNRQGNTIAPSSGEPPALPWHRNGEADDLVGDPGPGQVHPQLESVAESHPQFTNFLQPGWLWNQNFWLSERIRCSPSEISVWYVRGPLNHLCGVFSCSPLSGLHSTEAWLGDPQVDALPRARLRIILSSSLRKAAFFLSQN